MKLCKYTIAITIVMLALPAQAGTGSGLVRNIITTINGVIILTVDSHPNFPACGTVYTDFAFDGSTAEGKNKYALILAAANAKKPVFVQGTGDCSAWGDRETAQYISVAY